MLYEVITARITITVDELQRGIKAAESISDHVALMANTEGFEMVSEGDTDSVSLKLPKALLVDLQCSESIRSLFPMDYFSTMIKAIPSGRGSFVCRRTTPSSYITACPTTGRRSSYNFV